MSQTRGRFTGRVALITGASSGIGRACAEAFAREGARVALLARDQAALEETASLVRRAGGDALVLASDIGDRAATRAAVAQAAAHWSRLDIVVNNAGIGLKADLADTSDAAIDELVRTNLVGAITVTRAALPALHQSRGTIVLVSSVAGRRGFPHASVYSATKFALAGLAESLRVELAPAGIRTVLICPGRTDTAFFVKAGFPEQHGPGGRASMASPAAVAARIVRATARGQREDVLSRGGHLIVWLNKWAPALCDRMIARLPP